LSHKRIKAQITRDRYSGLLACTRLVDNVLAPGWFIKRVFVSSKESFKHPIPPTLLMLLVYNQNNNKTIHKAEYFIQRTLHLVYFIILREVSLVSYRMRAIAQASRRQETLSVRR
jgi:hypothetical protein